jgi:hypothetical protein
MAFTVEETTSRTIASGESENYTELTVEGDLTVEGELLVSPGISESGSASAIATPNATETIGITEAPTVTATASGSSIEATTAVESSAITPAVTAALIETATATDSGAASAAVVSDATETAIARETSDLTVETTPTVFATIGFVVTARRRVINKDLLAERRVIEP